MQEPMRNTQERLEGGLSGKDLQSHSLAGLREYICNMADQHAGSDAAEEEARLHQRTLTKPEGSLGRLEELAIWLARWQHRTRPRLERKRISLFVGTYALADAGVSAYPGEVTQQMFENFLRGGAAINQLAAVAESDLQVHELQLQEPVADFRRMPAMSEQVCLEALSWGMASVEKGLDVVALGEMGIGNSTAAAAICGALFGGDACKWTGPGSGVQGADLLHKQRVVAQGVALHRSVVRSNPLEALRCLGGKELAAICGAVLAAREQRIPVILDGFISCAAVAPLAALDDRLLRHCQVGHLSAEPAHADLVGRLGRRPLLDLGMRLGEGSGAAVALLLLSAAVGCHTRMATFTQAGVAERLSR